MSVTEQNFLKIQKEHDLRMATINNIKQWLINNGFKNTGVNIYERRLNSKEDLYVRLGKYVITYGQIFALGGEIKRKLINGIKYSKGQKIIIDTINEELKKY